MQIPPPVGSKAVYLVKDRFVLELIHFAGAGVHPAPRRVMNDLGFTHLSVAVDDMAAVVAKVRPAGGDVLEDTDMGGRAIMIRDPDGQLIELTTFGFRLDVAAWPDEVDSPRLTRWGPVTRPGRPGGRGRVRRRGGAATPH